MTCPSTDWTMSEPGHATPCHPRGLGHLLLASPDCTIAAPNLPLQAKQVLICSPAAPMQCCQSRIGRRARRDKPGAEHIIGPPVYLICSPCLPTSRLYLAPSSAPHDCIQPYLATVEPRDLTASCRCAPGKHWSPPPSPCDSRQLLPQPRPEHAVSSSNGLGPESNSACQ